MRNKLLLIITSGVFIFSGESLIPSQDFGGIRVVVQRTVDAGSVEGVKSVRAKYSYKDDAIYIIKKPWLMSRSKYHMILIHELVHATGHKSRLARVDVTKSVDWYIEEVIAETSLYLILGKRFNKAYINRHPLNRDLTADEWDLVDVESKRAVQWIYEHTEGLNTP